jgi:hypothetical protein
LTRVTKKICALSLEFNACQADVQKDFAYPSTFDDVLLGFLIGRRIARVDEVATGLSPHIPGPEDEPPAPVEFPFPVRPLIARKGRAPILPGTAKIPNPYPFLKLYLSLVRRLRANTPEKQIVLKSALIRIIADRLYLIDPVIRTCDETVCQNLGVVQRLTIGDMQAPGLPFGVAPDCVIGKLGESNQVMKAVSHYIEGLQFDRSPLDLAEKLSMVCATIDGMNGSAGKNMDLCFDEFFAIFLVMFSVCPPVNVTGISYLFSVFGCLEYSPVFKHAITSFSAWASFMNGFLNEAHPPQVREKIDAILAERS